MPVHGIDNGNNKHEVYTTEEVLSILQQAINSGSLQGIDPTQTPIVAAVRESHNNSNITFWSGTEAEFNELTGVTSELVGARIGSDGKLYVLTGDTTLSDTIQACYDAALEATEGMKREVISVTLMANAWSDTAPYTQTVGVAGMTADKDFLAPYVVPTGNESDDLAAQAALSCISGGTTDTDSVTFYCYDEKPTTTITVFMVDKGTKIEPGGYPIASKTAPGIMQVGDGLIVDENGKVSAQEVEETPLKFHSVAASKATYIVELPNGKNILIDTGLSSSWSAIKTAVDGLGIEKFDYAILTHFHSDHTDNVQNFIDNYDMSNCVWYIQMKPDYAHHSAEIVVDTEAAYDANVQLLITNGFIPTVPENDSYITVDAENDVKLHFLNTDATIAENYYGRYGEWLSALGVNNNVFSLITEIIHKDVKILACGDIERPVEEQFVDKLGKVNIMTAPHHGTNRDDLKAFYSATMPDFAICSDPDLTDSSIRSFMKGRFYLKEFGSQIISPTHSEDVNGLFSFESNGERVISHVQGGALTETAFNFNNSYQEIDGLIQWSSQDQSTLTLEQMLANLPQGFDMSEMMSNVIQANYAQVVTDIKSVFGISSMLSYMTIRKRRLFQEITLFDKRKKFTAIRNTYPDGTTTSWDIKGEGLFSDYITGKENLLSQIGELPVGQYSFIGYKETGSTVLNGGSNYALSVDVVNHSSSSVDAKISAIIRDDSEDLSYLGDKAITAEAFYKSSTTPSILSWRKTS